MKFKKEAVFWSSLMMVFFLTSISCKTFASDSEPEISVPNLQIYPQGWLTIRDNILVLVNVTSSVDLKSVTLFLTISDIQFIVGDGLNYSAIKMAPYDIEERTWFVYLPRQEHPVWVGLYVEAMNENNQTGTLFSREYPHIFPITEIPEPYISSYNIQITDIIRRGEDSWANLTFNIQGRFPYPQPWPYLQVEVMSLPKGYLINRQYVQEVESVRFWYFGKLAGLVDMDGEENQRPYDSYDLDIEISILYPNVPLLYNDTIQLYPADSFAKTESYQWKIKTNNQSFFYEENETKMAVTFRMERIRPPLDPMPLIGFANFILLGSAMVFPVKKIGKRLNVYLAAIIFPITALLGERLNPLGFEITIYDTYFSYVMLATAVLVFVSIIASRLEGSRLPAWILDPLAGIAIFLFVYEKFSETALPDYAKFSPLLILIMPIVRMLTEFMKNRNVRPRVELSV